MKGRRGGHWCPVRAVQSVGAVAARRRRQSGESGQDSSMKPTRGGSMTTNSGTAILSRLIEPENDDLSPDAARSILRLDFPKKDHARVRKLSAKASAGKLSDDERQKLEEYLRVSDLLALLQSKARLSLKNAGVGRSCALVRFSTTESVSVHRKPDTNGAVGGRHQLAEQAGAKCPTGSLPKTCENTRS
jgi:hypothetical protein